MNRSGPLGKWSMSSVSTITAHPHSSRHTQTASRAVAKGNGELGSVHCSTVEMECAFQSFSTKRKSW